MFRFLTACSLALLISAFGGLRCASSSEEIEVTASNAVAVDLSEYLDAYAANAVAADLNYKDKDIIFRGRVAEFIPTNEGSTVLLWSESHALVACNFSPMHTNVVAQLEKGVWVELRGKAESRGVAYPFDVTLRSCSVLEEQDFDEPMARAQAAKIRIPATPKAPF